MSLQYLKKSSFKVEDFIYKKNTLEIINRCFKMVLLYKKEIQNHFRSNYDCYKTSACFVYANLNLCILVQWPEVQTQNSLFYWKLLTLSGFVMNCYWYVTVLYINYKIMTFCFFLNKNFDIWSHTPKQI